MPRALIVHAHPEPGSFCTAQMRQAASTLQARGYEVEISDLYAQGWNAGLGRGNFMHAQGGHFKPQAEQVRAAQNHTFAPDVAAELNKLLAADLLVFSFPLWWFSLPALLKGWVDRVFVMGAVYGAGVGTYDNGKFLGRALLCTTGGPESAYGPQANNGELNTALFLTGPGVTTLPIEIFSYLQFQGGQLVIAAASAVQVGMILLIVLLVERIIGLTRVIRSK